jgi:4-hydroxybenzoate polyprenyltransferase
MGTLGSLLRTLRPDQWIKNLVLFAGLIFAGGLTDPELIGLAISGFIVFCMLSGAVYVINDMVDLESDRKHPEKRIRPLASGELSMALAATVAVGAAAGGLAWAYSIHMTFGHVSLGYLLLNVLYSLILRRMVILDVMSIAIGFVLRAAASVEVLRVAAPDTELSPWLLICTFFLALFLGLGKRRAESISLGGDAGGHRAALDHYPIVFVDGLIGIVTASTVISYSIYTIWPGTVQKIGSADLVYTIPFVVYGLFRYLFLVLAGDGGAKPSKALTSDTHLAIAVVLWVGVVICVLYSS